MGWASSYFLFRLKIARSYSVRLSPYQYLVGCSFFLEFSWRFSRTSTMYSLKCVFCFVLKPIRKKPLFVRPFRNFRFI